MASQLQRTVLVQERISNPSRAIDRFSQGGNRVPLVLVPDERWKCSFTFTVPSGVNCIQHRFGKDVSENTLAEPGLKCLPFWYKIAYCVTPSSNTYNAPVKQCPTLDCVMVNCDLTLVFSINNNPKDVKSFVYNLGANRFSSFLAAATEEGIRQLVRQTPHHKVYELRGGSQVKGMLDELNNKFSLFGVTFLKVAITDVQFHGNLSQILEETTEFDSKIKEHMKQHEYLMKSVNYKADQEIEEEKKKNDRVIQDLSASSARAIIQREQAEIEAKMQYTVSITSAEEKASVQESAAKNKRIVSDIEAKKSVDIVVSRARSKAEQMRIAVDQEARRLVYESEQAVEKARDNAAALMLEAKAEGSASSQLQKEREHQLGLQKQEILELLAQNGNIVVSGKNGDALISSLLDSIRV